MRPFDQNSPKLSEKNTLFYAHIGLVTVRFAELESLVSHIIEKIINSDDDVIASTLIEGNSLSTNLHLLEKINRSRCYKEQEIKTIIKKINESRIIRNSLIHGVWSEVIENNGELRILCSNHNHIFKKVSDTTKHWSRYGAQEFTLGDIKTEIDKIEGILITLRKIWIELNEDDVFW
jgi:hypothetical protein